MTQILHKDLGRGRYAPSLFHTVSHEPKEYRDNFCRLHPDLSDQSTTCQLHCSWRKVIFVFQYNPETNGQHMEWKTKSSLRPKIFHLQNLSIKRITFFSYILGITYKEVMSEGKTSSEFYTWVLEMLLKQILRERKAVGSFCTIMPFDDCVVQLSERCKKCYSTSNKTIFFLLYAYLFLQATEL
jgi:hypothetical protein